MHARGSVWGGCDVPRGGIGEWRKDLGCLRGGLGTREEETGGDLGSLHETYLGQIFWARMIARPARRAAGALTAGAMRRMGRTRWQATALGHGGRGCLTA
eukprot:scaffold21055_cov122-Isochrysis_galbana.AAC.1